MTMADHLPPNGGRRLRWKGVTVARPIDLGSLLGGASRLLFVLALLFALVVLKGQLAESDEADACRSQVSGYLSAAQADFLIATGDRVTDGDTDLEALVFVQAKERLRLARNARLSYELHPEAECPVLPDLPPLLEGEPQRAD